MRALLAGILVALWTAVPALAEELSGSDIVARAVEAAGGEVWKRPESLILTGTMTLYKDGRYDQKTVADAYRMWRVFPQASADAHKANGKVRLEAFAGGRRIFQISFDGETTYNQDGPVPGAQASEEWSESFGFGILRFADGEGFSVARLADDTVDGHASYFVEVADPAGSKTVFGIDKATFDIRLVGFDTPRGWHVRIYDGFVWHENPRFKQPQSVRLYYDGRLTNDVFWETYKVNAAVPDEIFVLPAKGAE